MQQDATLKGRTLCTAVDSEWNVSVTIKKINGLSLQANNINPSDRRLSAK
jgi:hypothetical protein